MASIISVISRVMCQNVTRYCLQNVSKNWYKNFHCLPRITRCIPSTFTLQTPVFTQQRYKSKKKQAKADQEAEEDSDNDEELEIDDFDKELVDKNTRIFETRVNSLRADVIMKTGLGIARNKIEEAFYDSRIRINGKKIFKKSELVQEGDELDLVKGIDLNNTNFLTVARVELLAAVPKGDGLKVKMRRCKALTIENYEDPWSP